MERKQPLFELKGWPKLFYSKKEEDLEERGYQLRLDLDKSSRRLERE